MKNTANDNVVVPLHADIASDSDRREPVIDDELIESVTQSEPSSDSSGAVTESAGAPSFQEAPPRKRRLLKFLFPVALAIAAIVGSGIFLNRSERTVADVDADMAALRVKLDDLQHAQAQRQEEHQNDQQVVSNQLRQQLAQLTALQQTDSELRQGLSELSSNLAAFREQLAKHNGRFGEHDSQLAALAKRLADIGKQQTQSVPTQTTARKTARTFATGPKSPEPPRAAASMPPFRLVSIEFFNLNTYAVIRTMENSLISLREDDRWNGWQLVQIDAEAGRAAFASGSERRWLDLAE